MSSDTFFSLGPGPELYPDALQRPRREAYRTFKTSFKQSSFPIPFERAGQRNLVQEYARKVAGEIQYFVANASVCHWQYCLIQYLEPTLNGLHSFRCFECSRLEQGRPTEVETVGFATEPWRRKDDCVGRAAISTAQKS
eukprot:3630744-Rhodomonas_salina.1